MTADPFDHPDHADAVRQLAAGPPVEPSAGLKIRLLAALPPPPQVVYKPSDDAAFRPTKQPGVSVRLLYLDRAADRFSAFLKLAPGARLRPHRHAGVEECVVLAGTMDVGGRTLRAGDYQRAESGSPHGEQVSADGCLLFLSGPLALLAE
jgi:anti-sigma factor ChrR (cupin superfamily)